MLWRTALPTPATSGGFRGQRAGLGPRPQLMTIPHHQGGAGPGARDPGRARSPAANPLATEHEEAIGLWKVLVNRAKIRRPTEPKGGTLMSLPLPTSDPSEIPVITPIDGLEHLEAVSTAPGAATSASRARAVVYLRVSKVRQLNTASDIDEDGNSIATQREWVRDKAVELGASIVAEFVEPGQSAQTIAKRPEFRRLLQ
ncbi:hypothetical protein PlfCFBP13513_03395 [Plantibacter flavus]|nr:hypothetical protein PlfCFBP13513_03395 [Plantibacter flavus]